MRAEILEVVDGHAVVLTPFYKMAEADWVILRLVGAGVNDETPNALSYLIEKYGLAVIYECCLELCGDEE